jgi:hypothetical protein
LQVLKARLDVSGRQLKIIARHVAIGTGSAVALEAVEPTIEKAEQAARDGNATLTFAFVTDYRFEHIFAGPLFLCGGDRA